MTLSDQLSKMIADAESHLACCNKHGHAGQARRIIALAKWAQKARVASAELMKYGMAHDAETLELMHAVETALSAPLEVEQ